MWFIRTTVNVLQSLLPVLFGLFFVFLIYGYITNQDYEDSFTVTFTFSCKSVLANTHEYPPIVVDECAKLQRQISKGSGL